MGLPLSVFLITRNEEARLGRTLDAVAGLVGEIVIVDSGSTDATLDIAKAHGARIFHNDWRGYGQQKRFAEDQCRFDWLFNLDADEVVTPELAAEIAALFAGNGPEPGAYRVKIRNVYPGDSKPRPFAQTYNVVRLYHRGVGRYRDHPVHDRVVLNGIEPHQLAAPIHHFSFLSFAHLIDKGNRVTDIQAQNAKPRNLLALRLRLIVEMPVSFVKYYFLRGHVFGGYKGFFVALTAAFTRTARIAKILRNAED